MLFFFFLSVGLFSFWGHLDSWGHLNLFLKSLLFGSLFLFGGNLYLSSNFGVIFMFVVIFIYGECLWNILNGAKNIIIRNVFEGNQNALANRVKPWFAVQHVFYCVVTVLEILLFWELINRWQQQPTHLPDMGTIINYFSVKLVQIYHSIAHTIVQTWGKIQTSRCCLRKFFRFEEICCPYYRVFCPLLSR